MSYRILILAGLLCETLFAQCQVKQVCDDFGMNCSPQQVCEDIFRIPAVETPPLPPALIPSVKPADLPPIPSLGNSGCQQQWVCENRGGCHFENICR